MLDVAPCVGHLLALLPHCCLHAVAEPLQPPQQPCCLEPLLVDHGVVLEHGLSIALEPLPRPRRRHLHRVRKHRAVLLRRLLPLLLPCPGRACVGHCAGTSLIAFSFMCDAVRVAAAASVVHVQCVCVHGKQVWVGTGEGTVSVHQQGTLAPLALFPALVSRDPVVAIAVLGSPPVVAIASARDGGSVYLFKTGASSAELVPVDISLCQTTVVGARVGGVGGLPLSLCAGQSTMAVAAGKRLTLVGWNGLAPREALRVLLPDKVECLAWHAGTLAVGHASAVRFVNTATGAVLLLQELLEAVFPDTGRLFWRRQRSLLQLVELAPDTLLIIHGDHAHTLAVDERGRTRLRPLPVRFAESIVAAALLDGIYVVGVSASGNALQVVNHETGTLYTPVECAGASLIATCEGHGVVATSAGIAAIEPALYATQLEQLRAAGLSEDAVSVLARTSVQDVPDRFWQLRELQTARAWVLFDQQQYTRAMDVLAEWLASPQQVLARFPAWLWEGGGDAGGGAAANTAARVPGETAGEEDTAHTISLLDTPPLTPKELASHEQFAKALRAVIPFLVQAKRTLARMAQSDSVRYMDTAIDAERYLETSGADTLATVSASVDTALFSCYSLTQLPLLLSFLRRPNSCRELVVAAALAHQPKLLAEFHHTQGHHGKALAVLAESGEVEAVAEYLVQLVTDDGHGDDTALRALVWEYTRWVMARNRLRGWEVLLEHDTNRVLMPRDEVLAFVDTTEEEDRGMLAMRYLEGLAAQTPDTRTHTLLAERYLAVGTSEALDRLLRMVQGPLELETRRLLRALAPHVESGALRRLLLLQVGLLQRLQEHTQCLEILVHRLHSPELAVDYCLAYAHGPDPAAAHTPGPAHASPPGLAHTLLVQLVEMYTARSEDHELLVLVLSHPRVGAYLLLKDVLARLPPEQFTVRELEQFLVAQLLHTTREVNQQRLELGLGRSGLVLLDHAILVGHKATQHTTVAETTACAVCGRRLGRSVLLWLPDGSVVHSGCAPQR